MSTAISETLCTAESLLKRMEAEPEGRDILYEILHFCKVPRSSSEIDAMYADYIRGRAPQHSCRTYMVWLLELGGIERVKDATDVWITTGAGAEVLQAVSPANRIQALIAMEPDHLEVYRFIMKFCEIPQTRQEIEKAYRESAVSKDPELYPAYFTGCLEEAGALIWNGKWQTAPAGSEYLKTLLHKEEQGENV